MVLVEVLTQLGVHPIPENYVLRLEELAFKHFRAQEALMDRCECIIHTICVYVYCAYIRNTSMHVCMYIRTYVYTYTCV